MILVRSKSKGFVGLLIGMSAIPTQADIVAPGKPNVILQWLCIVLVDDVWQQVPLTDLEPVIPDEVEVDKDK